MAIEEQLYACAACGLVYAPGYEPGECKVCGHEWFEEIEPGEAGRF